jgi:hypothetical protein
MEPAASLIRLFGGPDRVAEITGRDRTRVYRWMWPRDQGGTDGEIPAKPRRALMDYAQRHNLKVPPEAWIGL